MMKISICIPQYNRIPYLLKSLQTISGQEYDNIEVVISDDFSSDDTESRIQDLAPGYKYPLIYSRNTSNLGYDRNYRKAIELASGDYCFVLGNDDTLYAPDTITKLVKFLMDNDLPEIGFTNYAEFLNRDTVIQRAHQTAVIGSGARTALKYYSCFSFVAGLIYKRSSFMQYNTDKQDGSIYAQLYLGVLMILKGCRLFSIMEPMVIKDIYIEGGVRASYEQRLARTWKDYKRVDGGMPSVIQALLSAFEDAGAANQSVTYAIFRHIYVLTYPHWLLDFRANKAFPEAVGLASGMRPSLNRFLGLLNFWNRCRIWLIYLFSTLIGLFTPVIIFRSLKNRLYRFFKK